MRPKKSAKKKIWMSMFFSYTVIIFLCFGIYSSVLLFETYISGRRRQEQETQLQTQQVVNLLDTRLLAAQQMAANINTSNTIKQLYLGTLGGDILDSYMLYQSIDELKSIYSASQRLDLKEVVVFINGYSKAYSSTGVLLLNQPFQDLSLRGAQATVNSLAGYFGFANQNELAFATNGLLYISEYTGTGATSRGRVAVLFSMEGLRAEMEALLDKNAAVRLIQNGSVLWQMGEEHGTVRIAESGVQTNLTVEIYGGQTGLPQATTHLLAAILFGTLLLTIAFLGMAYFFTHKHYKPIVDIKQLITTLPTDGKDEMGDIIEGIKSLIGERNGYREQMITIAPYAQQGMLHGVLTGNMQNETVQILSSKNYLNLQKPFFTISALNFSWTKRDRSDETAAGVIRTICESLCKIFSNEERGVYTFSKDTHNVFLIVNTDTDEPQDDLFFQMHRFIAEALDKEPCVVTMGIDEMQDDIGQLQAACLRALQALEEIMISGRGEVYFYEAPETPETPHYYFPKNTGLKLASFVKEKNADAVHALLWEIYEKNLAGPHISTATLHALVDELHLTTVKCFKEITKLGTTVVCVEKITSYATLEEIFNYYYVAFETFMQRLPQPNGPAATDAGLGRAILQYVEENYAKPELSLQLLTDTFGVSGKYIATVYKNKLNTTYLQHLQQKRIERAIELLQQPGLTLEAVSEQCGYTNLLTFRRNFKAYTGTTPGEYRTNLFVSEP